MSLLFLVYLPVLTGLGFSPLPGCEEMMYSYLKWQQGTVSIWLSKEVAETLLPLANLKLKSESWREVGDWGTSLENCQFCEFQPSLQRGRGMHMCVCGGGVFLRQVWASFVGDTANKERLAEAAWAAEWVVLIRVELHPAGPGLCWCLPRTKWGPGRKSWPGHLAVLPQGVAS